MSPESRIEPPSDSFSLNIHCDQWHMQNFVGGGSLLKLCLYYWNFKFCVLLAYYYHVTVGLLILVIFIYKYSNQNMSIINFFISKKKVFQGRIKPRNPPPRCICPWLWQQNNFTNISFLVHYFQIFLHFPMFKKTWILDK